MKKWKVLAKFKSHPFGKLRTKVKVDEILKILLENRGIKTKKEIEEFINPKLETVTIASVGIDKKQLKKAIARIKLAISDKEQIVVFGDYDVDGICGTAILWETLNSLGAKAMPYIPHRVDEGYGLSIKGIENVKSQYKNVKLIITVDNGIVANKAVEFANKQGIDVIISDHHVKSKKIPNALTIVHTTKLCGTGVAYLLAQELSRGLAPAPPAYDHLALVALATVADLVPLKGANRTLLKFGLEALRKTKRLGLLELFKEAGLEGKPLGVYEIGHIIAPRLNAMGRLEYAMDSLRLICTNNPKRARDLANLLGATNKERQDLTLQMVLHAKGSVNTKKLKSLLFIAHESYEQGVIGLVAGKMVEEFYRPTIVVSIGEKYSKASARSISGFNMIEFIREHSSMLIDAGGHPMAAGFTAETAKLKLLQRTLENKAESLLNEDLLTRSLKIDLELPLSAVNHQLFEAVQEFAPFGMGNPEPAFISKKVKINDMRTVGAEGSHLKLKLSQSDSVFDAIGFGLGEKTREFNIGHKTDIVYVIEKDEWNGQGKLQLILRDIK
jgi:single-stranded-DNA-specific exonuclease